MKAVALALLVVLLASCGQHKKVVTTGVIVQGAGLPLSGHIGDDTYAVIRSDSLPAIYADFRSELAKLGIVRFDGTRYDCNKWVSFYVALAQARFEADAFHSSSGAQSLAIAEVWHRVPGGTHAVAAHLTERGTVFIDPQTGREVFVENSTIYFVKW